MPKMMRQLEKTAEISERQHLSHKLENVKVLKETKNKHYKKNHLYVD
jgi:hypothetical protein